MTKRKAKDRQKSGSQSLPQLSAIALPADRQRDLRIDSLRGLLLIVMTLDHFNSYIARATYQSFGYVSVAEGFFFLSAFVFAVVYARQAGDLNKLTMVGIKRAYLLYRYHIALVLLIFLLGFAVSLFREPWQVFTGDRLYVHPLTTVFQALFLIHQPRFMDILPMYCIFVLLSPFILFSFHRGWTALVFSVSLALWFLGQYITPLEWLSSFFPGSRAGYVNWIAWQLIWVGGMYLGFMKHNGRSLPLFLKDRRLMGVLFFAAIVLFLGRHGWINLGFNTEFAAWRPDVGWLRLLNFSIIVALVGYLLSHVPRNKEIPWVSFLGRYSLPVFSYHILLFFLLAPVSYFLLKSGHQHAFALLSLGGVLSLTIPALIKNRLELRKQSNPGRQIPG